MELNKMETLYILLGFSLVMIGVIKYFNEITKR